VFLRLSSKITALTGMAMVVTVASFTYLMLQSLNRVSLQEAIKDADYLSETIVRTTHFQMLDNHFERVHQMIVEVGNMKGMERIRLFNKRGEVKSSTVFTEMGTVFGADRGVCSTCHISEGETLTAPDADGRTRLIEETEGRTSLRHIRGIYNLPVCSTADCHVHPADTKVLGVLEVQMSLDNLRTVTSSFQNYLMVFIVSLLTMLAICLYSTTDLFINRPLSRLLEHTRRLASGKLDVEIRDVKQDEIGELAQSFNLMTKSLLKTRTELLQMTEGLEATVVDRTRKIEQMQQELIHSEKMASLGELVAGIAHEINNPLTGIMVFTAMTIEKSELPEGVREDLRIVLGETQRCADIVKGLLEFSRESLPTKQEVDVNGLIEATFALLERQVAFLNITIEKEYAGHLPLIHADPTQLKQVVMNMLVNASQAMEQGGTLAVATRVVDAGVVEISIVDTGCGISRDRLKNIFDPFYTTKKQGTGLGLSVSYGIVQNHGGSIDVESEVGVGTTFLIRLPVKQDPG